MTNRPYSNHSDPTPTSSDEKEDPPSMLLDFFENDSKKIQHVTLSDSSAESLICQPPEPLDDQCCN